MEKGAAIRVLWVEDDEDDYILCRSAVNAIPNTIFALTWATTYEAALAELEQRSFDVCLVDYRLGEHTGLDLLRELNRRSCEVPVIMLTGQGDRAIDVEAMQNGAADYLEKGKIGASLIERAIRYAIERNRLQLALRDLSLRDDLTALYNRRGFEAMADQHIKLARRQRQTFLIMYADVDRLKWINDTHGHTAGSQAISDTSHILRATFRFSDILARLGGDEFLALALNSNIDDAAAIGYRLSENLRQHNARGDRKFPLSMSIGFACFDPSGDTSLDEVIHEADQAMYRHKQGRAMTRGS